MAGQPWEQSTDEQLRPDAGSTADGAGARVEPGRVGQVLGGRFELLAVLGRGAMGIVYRARDRSVGEREVALKLVLGAGGSREARFEREGELTARLDHPGIVRVHDAGELDGARFLAYELVPGCRTLSDLIGDPTVPRRRLVEVVRDAARALGHAHARGVLHRDVKPSNILVDSEDRTRVADFGLAAATGLERLTQTGVVVGTPTHMAPEQLDPAHPPGGPTIDVWALGVVLYQTITGGALPFDGTSLVELVRLVARASPAPPREVDPTAPPELSDLCLALLRRDPRARPADGEAVAAALDAWLAGRPVGLVPLRRLPRRALALGAALALAAAALVVARLSPGDPAKELELEVAARRLCAASAALGSDAPARARLRDEVRAAPGGGARRAAAARLDALDALERAGRGDREGARSLALAALAAAPDVPGLAALGRALEADAPDAWEAAYAEGWRRPEVRAARAVARLRAGELDAQAAREALLDLEAALLARGGSAPAAEHEARAAALLALGRPAEAMSALDAGALDAGALRWRVLAAAARVGLQRSEPAGPWVERLPAGAPPPGAAAECARTAAVAREGVEAELRTEATGDAALRPLVDRLRLARRLEPDRPLAPDVAARLVTATTAIMAPMASPALLHDVGELLGDDVQGLGQLVRFVRGMGSPYKSALTPYALRLWELRGQLEPSGRVLLADSVGVLLREVGQPDLAEEVLDEGLRLCDDTALQAALLLERGVTRLERRDDAGALADAEAGLAIEPALVALWSLRVVCLRKVGRREEAFELVCRLLDREDLPQLGRADCDEAAKHAWELGRLLERRADLLPRLERYLVVRRDLAVWSVRLAWLHATLGGVEQARRYLTGAVELLRLDPQLSELAGTALLAVAALGGEEPVPGALRALVNALERPRFVRERERARDRTD